MGANNRLSLLASVMIILLTNSADPRSDGEFIGDLLVTKTTYEASFGGSEKMSAVLNATRTHLQMVGESCVALQINALIRHGIRYPGNKFYRNIGFMIELQEYIESEDFFYFKSQTNPFSDDVEPQMLAKTGKRELFNLGVRFAKYFSKLFSYCDAERCEFVSSNKSRTVDSAIAFIQGLQSTMGDETNMKENITILSNTADGNIIRFFDLCEKFVKSVEQNETALINFHSFGEGPELNALVTRIRKKLGINKLKLTNVHVRKLYDLCANSMAIFNDASWCDVFTLEDLRIMEYWLDLKHYWRKSYGYKINYHISCQLLQHIFSTLEDAMMDERTVLSNHDNSPVGVFRFGHAETFLPLLSILGLYKDEDNILRYDNYHSNRNRTFRTSKLSPFAGNIAFVLYSCTDSTGNSMYMIEVLLHEQPVTLPCCTSTLCSYDVIKEFYSKWLEDCDFTEICRMRNEILPSKDEILPSKDEL